MTSQPTKVLVAGDDPTLREVLRITLDLKGCDILTAADGAEAIATAERTSPDVVVLDGAIRQPDGFDVCMRLKRGSNPPQVLIVTGMNGFEREHEAVLSGADGYLCKPFSPLELLGWVDAQARMRKRRRVA